jgi:hypothetical protein
MKFPLILFVALMLSFATKAQTMVTMTIGNLELVQEAGVAKLMNAKVNVQKPKTMPGFRVQLASSPNRNEVLELKTQFLRHHPKTRAYVTYQQPYFKLRVGDFEQRADASVFMNEIYNSFPGFIVSDVINTSDSEPTAENKTGR